MPSILSVPEQDNREAIEAEIPDGHREFVNRLIDKYKVPAATKPGMRSRFVRSTEMEDQQLDAIMASDVDLFACGIGAPPRAMDRAKSMGKKTCALVGSPHHVQRVILSFQERTAVRHCARFGQPGVWNGLPRMHRRH